MPTAVATAKGYQLAVLKGDGAGPEVFTPVCIINTSRGIMSGSRVIETVVPFCGTDADEPAWVERAVDELSRNIDGDGVLDTASLLLMNTWYESGQPSNVRMVLIANTLDGYWGGSAVLPNFEVAGSTRKENLTFKCSIMSNGIFKWTDA